MFALNFSGTQKYLRSVYNGELILGRNSQCRNNQNFRLYKIVNIRIALIFLQLYLLMCSRIATTLIDNN